MCSKAWIFHLKVGTASALMSGDVLAMEAIYNFLYKNNLDYHLGTESISELT